MINVILYTLLISSSLLCFIYFLNFLENIMLTELIKKRTLIILIVSFGLMVTSLALLDSIVKPTKNSIQINECIEKEDCIIRTIQQRCFLNEDGTIKRCDRLED